MTNARESTMQVGVMGAGAVGTFFGAMLARSGVPVTLVGRERHVRAIESAGLEVTSGGRVDHVRMAASTDMAALATMDAVLVAVKSVDTEVVAQELARVLPPDTLVVSLQNGVDNAWRMSAHLPNPVVPAAVYVSAEMPGDGRLRHNGGGSIVAGRPLRAGVADDAAGSALDALVAHFVAAGVPCRVSDDIRVDLWTKLTANCAYNAISALSQLRYRHIAANDGTRDVMRMVTEENAAVAAAEGVPVSVEALALAVRKIVEAMPEALSSTAQDLALRRPTEIDSLNGFVVRRGQALGVPTPVNRTLQALVGLVEQSQRTPA
jgi:2-dehydropantoate 2-reductase